MRKNFCIANLVSYSPCTKWQVRCGSSGELRVNALIESTYEGEDLHEGTVAKERLPFINVE